MFFTVIFSDNLNYDAMIIEDLTGKKFGKLTVIERSYEKDKQRGRFYKCICDCGRLHIGRAGDLKFKRVTSCFGCAHTRHGKSRTKEFHIWTNMKYRCNNPDSQMYHKYGGRGIKVCVRWNESFKNFITDMGMRPSPKHSIERIDNNGDYTPSNCKWALSIDQMNNRSVSVFYAYNGISKTATQWGREFGLNDVTLVRRIKNGWSMEKALTTPLMDSKFKKGLIPHNKK